MPRYKPEFVTQLVEMLREEGITKDEAQIVTAKIVTYQGGWEASGRNAAELHFVVNFDTLRVRVHVIEPEHQETRTEYMEFGRLELPDSVIGEPIAIL